MDVICASVSPRTSTRAKRALVPPMLPARTRWLIVGAASRPAAVVSTIQSPSRARRPGVRSGSSGAVQDPGQSLRLFRAGHSVRWP